MFQNLSAKEKKLLQLISKNPLGPSHNIDHLENVLRYAFVLVTNNPCDISILVPACLVHDLGRQVKKLHEIDSLLESGRRAKIILAKAGYSRPEIQKIVAVVVQHDQPKRKCTSMEAAILKEADFLDGFGARGISRSACWHGESDKDFTLWPKKLYQGMEERFLNLDFPISKSLSYRQLNFARVFFDELKTKRVLIKPKGQLIVFEGISGTGKETQAKLLQKYLEKKGRQAEIIYHPTSRLKQTLKHWRKGKINLFSEALMIMADRYQVCQQKIVPGLQAGKTVISLRNSLSCLVYQAQNPHEENMLAWMFSTFEPYPDELYYFDLDPKLALVRINRRTENTGEEKGKFENLEALKEKRKRYLKIIINYPGFVSLDAGQTISQVHKQICQNLSAAV